MFLKFEFNGEHQCEVVIKHIDDKQLILEFKDPKRYYMDTFVTHEILHCATYRDSDLKDCTIALDRMLLVGANGGLRLV